MILIIYQSSEFSSYEDLTKNHELVSKIIMRIPSILHIITTKMTIMIIVFF